jgi:hypothetical protein
VFYVKNTAVASGRDKDSATIVSRVVFKYAMIHNHGAFTYRNTNCTACDIIAMYALRRRDVGIRAA